MAGFPLLDEPPPLDPRADYAPSVPLDLTQSGVGLLVPFRRAELDFASDSGDALVRSGITQVLLTRADDGRAGGELPWRPEFGSLLHRLQYMAIDDSFAGLIRSRVIGAVSAWEPRAEIHDVEVHRRENGRGELEAFIRVSYSIVQTSTGATQTAVRALDVPLR
jgi:phage baseplate assembly protein W